MFESLYKREEISLRSAVWIAVGGAFCAGLHLGLLALAIIQGRSASYFVYGVNGVLAVALCIRYALIALDYSPAANQNR